MNLRVEYFFLTGTPVESPAHPRATRRLHRVSRGGLAYRIHEQSSSSSMLLERAPLSQVMRNALLAREGATSVASACKPYD